MTIIGVQRMPRTLARPRAVIQRTFNTVATITRKATVSDGRGGTTDAYPTETTLRCSFARSQAGTREREAASAVESLSEWTFVFAYDADIRTTDRIVCEGRTFEVVGAGIGSYDLANRVTCMEIL